MNEEHRTWPLVEVVDPSTTRGLYVIWFQCDKRTDRWYMVHAAHVESGPISVMVQSIKAERRFVGREPDLAIMDAKGGAQKVDMEKAEDWFMRFRQLGLDYVPNDEPATLEELDEWLKPVWDPVLQKAVPKLMICERVAAMEQGPLWALQRFQWDPLMTHKALYCQPGKDFVDCMKYLCNQKSVNRLRKSGDARRVRVKVRQRHAKLVASYGFGGSPRSRSGVLWGPPRMR